jgi:hypothetical protein
LLKALAGSGIVKGDKVAAGGIKERVEVDHVAGPVVCPFENLWPDVYEERVRGPWAEDHDFSRGTGP